MTRKTIRLFMWGYQEHLRLSLRRMALSLFERIGASVQPEILLVGVASEGTSAPHPVCIEPEDGRWRLADFATIPQEFGDRYRADQRHMMFVTDERTSAEMPSRIARQVLGELVKEHIDAADGHRDVTNFATRAFPVGDYEVVCVLQLPAELADRFRPINYVWQKTTSQASFLLSCVAQILEHASLRLQQAEPGRSLQDLHSVDELILRAARSFLQMPLIDERVTESALFDNFESLSLSRYEGRDGIGRLAIAPAPDAVTEGVQFSSSVRLSDTRWARKLLAAARHDVCALADTSKIYGLGKVDAQALQSTYHVDFIGRHQWDFKRGDQILLRVRDGLPRLPQDVFDVGRFTDNVGRLFPTVNPTEIPRLLNMLHVLGQRSAGSLLIISEDAEAEAARLAGQGTPIVPVVLSDDLLRQAANLDGAILATPYGVCHAIGVVLDGPADEFCVAERGARYNSAVRYTRQNPGRIAIIYSDDQTVDVVPLLRLRVKRTDIEEAISALEAATREDFHEPRMFVDEHRFYLDQSQCVRINAALDRIENLPLELGEITFSTARFRPNPEMDETYLI